MEVERYLAKRLLSRDPMPGGKYLFDIGHITSYMIGMILINVYT